MDRCCLNGLFWMLKDISYSLHINLSLKNPVCPLNLTQPLQLNVLGIASCRNKIQNVWGLRDKDDETFQWIQVQFPDERHGWVSEVSTERRLAGFLSTPPYLFKELLFHRLLVVKLKHSGSSPFMSFMIYLFRQTERASRFQACGL